MLESQPLILLMQRRELSLTRFERIFERTVTCNTRLLRKLLVLLVKLRPLVLPLRQLGLRLIQLLCDIVQVLRVLSILCLDELHLLARVRQHDHVVDDLTSQSGQLFISLLNLLVQRLILDFQLLVIDQVQSFSQLLLLLQHLLLIR